MSAASNCSGEDGVRNITDLKGKSVGVQAWGSSPHVLVALMAAHVGLDPAKDIRWVIDPSLKPIERFSQGKIDAFLGFPPEPQDLRARHIGHVVVNSTVDRPWSQYFCCMLAGNRDYVRKYPVATKRVLRAILKATDLCATEPTRVARQIVDGGFTDRYDYACRRLTRSLTTNGANTTPRTRSGSTRCACTRPASSSRARRRSSPTAPIGAF